MVGAEARGRAGCTELANSCTVPARGGVASRCWVSREGNCERERARERERERERASEELLYSSSAGPGSENRCPTRVPARRPQPPPRSESTDRHGAPQTAVEPGRRARYPGRCDSHWNSGAGERAPQTAVKIEPGRRARSPGRCDSHWNTGARASAADEPALA
jgi:hypothetical protein